uniref:Membrane spanning 4-domains A13 n=1 Tax=Colobus angolensis palliatus TaxID=336983 RepID=A0A2K5HZ56_COLAP
MIGIFHVFMWYFLLVLYKGQIKGAFGIYEPITYKTGCTLWGIFFQRQSDLTSVAEEAENTF